MKIKTHIKAGTIRVQHNETQQSEPAQQAADLKLKTHIKAGTTRIQHNETQVRAR